MKSVVVKCYTRKLQVEPRIHSKKCVPRYTKLGRRFNALLGTMQKNKI